ncbi:hypothetical protein [Streptomyces zagrosensis]|uniref:Uncharacterized protein n=1 Tax=Streptomyces zagrosensis TaxID=1042984 RepID=A0A7W9QHB5_9ACTN|nr:hypothetical protein [Streptomyces zagrosensis]MBB5940029.1 hypothetical protein [Streptomyces zagrosensis]
MGVTAGGDHEGWYASGCGSSGTGLPVGGGVTARPDGGAKLYPPSAGGVVGEGGMAAHDEEDAELGGEGGGGVDEANGDEGDDEEEGEEDAAFCVYQAGGV